VKLAIVLEDTISSGGGFNQALNAIIQMERLSKDKFTSLILTNKAENLPVLKQLGLSAITFRTKLMDKVIGFLGQNELTRRWLHHFKWVSPFEKLLLKSNCDIVYFVSPTVLVACLQRLNYILTAWDNCHRDFPEFPEVRSHGQFMHREFVYHYLLQAYLTLVDSEELADRLHRRYGVDRVRLLVMPFAPNPLLKAEQTGNFKSVLDQYGLKPGFLLYPAQFWPHKNHIRIVQALALLRRQGEEPTVVFVGGDKGNKKIVADAVIKEGLQAQVADLGFVPTEHLQVLYEGCAAVVMPTYFGPTNIPPLEAWQARRPLIYSQHLAQQCGDAALLIDPDDAQSLSNAMLQIKEGDTFNELVVRGESRLSEIARQREQAEANLLRHLNKFERRCSTWAR
jgi:glycosyltransferase involved in cell wall biosynthesis